MEVGTYHFTQVPSPKYDMDAYMAILFVGEVWVLRVGSSKKLDPTLKTSLTKIFP